MQQWWTISKPWVDAEYKRDFFVTELLEAGTWAKVSAFGNLSKKRDICK